MIHSEALLSPAEIIIGYRRPGMKNFRITLQYDGSRYDGWQKQGNTDNEPGGRG